MKLKLVNPLFMWLIVILGVTISYLILPATELLPVNITRYLLVPGGIYWLVLFFSAIKVNRQAAQSAAHIRKLITTGIYSRVRHPIYSADIVLIWAVFFAYPYWWVLAAAVWLTTVLFFWMRLEEKALTQRFGEEYKAYKKKVPMFFPSINSS